MPQIFEDAVYAWKSGEFEGESVFQAEDPGGPVTGEQVEPDPSEDRNAVEKDPVPAAEKQQLEQNDVGRAGMRIDLTRIGGK